LYEFLSSKREKKSEIISKNHFLISAICFLFQEITGIGFFNVVISVCSV